MQYKVFGCKVNKYFTDKWLQSPALRNESGIFVASCVVTDKAKRKWIRFVKQNVEKLPAKHKMFISGCGAFEMGKENERFFEVYTDLLPYRKKIVILPEKPEPHPTPLLKGEGEKNQISWVLKNLPKIPQIFTKKFVLIQWWCDSYCTFCLTVVKRGKHFWREKEDILEEILDAQRQDIQEVVLTGVNLCAWGLETTNDIGKSRFAELLKYLLKNTDIPRIRISSLWPEFIDDRVIKIFENPRIYPHFHFSIQSGSSEILKAMRRHYDGAYMRTLLQKTRNINRKDDINISIWADLIVGFPGEKEKNFEETLKLIEDFKISKVHGFPFSNHDYGEHVPAHFFKNQIDGKTKKMRLKKLLNTAQKVRDDFIKSQIGKEFEVLVEWKIVWDTWSWWTQNYIEADETNFKITSGKIKRGNLIRGILLGRSQKKSKQDESI